MKGKVVYIVFILIVLMGCYRDLDIYDEQSFESQLVLNSVIANDSAVVAFLSKTDIPEAIDSTDFIDNAVVALYEEDNFVDFFSLKVWKDEIKVYFLDYKPKLETRYSIKVIWNNQEVSAEAYIPDIVKILDYQPIFFLDTLSIVDSLVKIFIQGKINVKFFDPDSANYYAFIFVIEGQRFNDDSVLVSYFDDAFLIPTSGGRIFSELVPFFFAKEEATIMSDEYLPVQGDVVEMEFIFTENYTVKLGNFAKFHFGLANLSEDLYKYYETHSLYERAENSPFVEPVNVYSNVKGGLGIFGAMAVDWKTVFLK